MMGAFILIVVLCVLFHPSVMNGQVLTLSFNTSVYEGTNDYHAHIGEDVVLTCTVPITETRVYMYSGTSDSDYEVLVANGELGRDLINLMGKYSLTSFEGNYQLTIRNLDDNDSVYYGCRVCKYRRRRYRCLLPNVRKIVIVYLDVKEISDHSDIPDFCDLVGNTNGIFFTGNDLILRCPNMSFHLTASNGSFPFTVNFDIRVEGMYVNIMAIENLTETFNGTMLYCYNVEDNSTNYCRHFPQIKVFNELAIRISPGERVITDGHSVSFTCLSYPFVPFTVEWNIVDNDVLYGNVSESEITQGIRIMINDVVFLSTTSSLFVVVCNVTIGSENRIETASVYVEMQDVVTTQVTSPGHLLDIDSTKTSLGSTMTIKSDKFISPVYIAVPLIIVILIPGIIILGLVYIKVRKSGTSNEIDNQNHTRNQVAGRAEENAYDTRNNTNTKSELGLTYHNSEVVDNVAYVTYNEAYNQC